jgi:hypothetical protein
MRHVPGLAVVVFLALSGLALRADEPAAPAGAPVAADPAASLRAALQALAAQPTAAFSGTVEIRSSGMDAMMRMSQGMMSGGSKSEPFQGEFEAYQWEGRTIVASRTLVPGFAIFHDGSRTLTRTLYRSDPPDLSELHREILHLLNRATLAKALSEATWTPSQDPGGGTKLRARIEGKLLPEEANPMLAMMGSGAEGPTVEADADLSPTGQILQIRLRIERVDTARMIMDFAKKMGVGGDQLGNLPTGAADGPRPQTTYTLRPTGTSASERLKATVEEMTALASRP